MEMDSQFKLIKGDWSLKCDSVGHSENDARKGTSCLWRSQRYVHSIDYDLTVQTIFIFYDFYSAERLHACMIIEPSRVLFIAWYEISRTKYSWAHCDRIVLWQFEQVHYCHMKTTHLIVFPREKYNVNRSQWTFFYRYKSRYKLYSLNQFVYSRKNKIKFLVVLSLWRPRNSLKKSDIRDIDPLYFRHKVIIN